MAQNVNPTFVKTPNNGLVQISTGTGTANVTIYTGAANGSKVIALNATNQSSGTANIRFAITNGITTYIIGEANIPLSAGFVGGATPSVSLFSAGVAPGLPVDSDGNPYLILKSSADTLTAAAESTIVSGIINLVAIVGDF